MIPILFNATSTEFDSNGIGRLSGCTSCTVTEERNGIYEVEFTYPITGAYYSDIELGKVIVVTHDEKKDKQPFVIYRRSAPIDGLVVFNAHHISYELSKVIVKPFEAPNIQTAFTRFKTEAMTSNPFTFWTDKTTTANFSVTTPTSVRALLGGHQGSILDVFGSGDYEFDKYTVKLHANRGRDRGVTIRYGKNLTNLVYDTDSLSLYDSIVPYWSNNDTVVYGNVVNGDSGWENHIVTTMDFSQDFQDAPTTTQLEARAMTFLEDNTPWYPHVNVKVDFVALWQTEEYKNIAPLERVQLCDTVTVQYTELGVDVKARVIKTVWNALLDRYDSIEIGDVKTSFADTIIADTNSLIEGLPDKSMMQEAIDHATELITGGLGGHVVFQYDANGKPTEILVMDTDDADTAIHVLRINVNGIGFSSSGVAGPYTSAWTLDGHFVADFIASGRIDASEVDVVNIDADNINTGSLSADLISGGTFKVGGSNGSGASEIRAFTIQDVLYFLLDYSGMWLYEPGTTTGLKLHVEEDGITVYNNTTPLMNLWVNGTDVELRSRNGDVYLTPKSNGRAYINYEVSSSAFSPLSVVGSHYDGDSTSSRAVKEIHYYEAFGIQNMAFTPFSGTTYMVQVTTSDEKLKKNIKDAEDIGLDTINRIKHKSFDFKDGGYHRDCGYIAQQLRDVIPYSTISAPEHDEAGNQIGETLQLNDHEILVYATKAIQELSAKVDELERRL